MPPKRKKADVAHEETSEEELDVLKGNDTHTAPKRARKGKAKANVDDEGNPLPLPEKRVGIYKKKCPKTILERMERCLMQRFFLIDRERDPQALKETFKVLGSTGNVYTIVITNTPSCDCPDGSKGNCCKHIIFVFLKVLGQPQESNLWYQKGLLTTELADIFASARPVPQNVVNGRLTQAFAVANGQEPVEAYVDEPNGKQRLPEDGDTCPICYEDLPAGEAKDLVFCSTGCGGGLHAECFQQWAKTSKPVTCVYCRTKWPEEEINYGSAVASTSEGYTNLAGTMGISGVRDASTYYQGPQRGKSWQESRKHYSQKYGAQASRGYNGYGGRNYEDYF